MREFFLADLDYRSSVNLKNYSEYIGMAVHTILEDAEVIVEENRFIILNDNLRNIESRAIGKLIASTPLGAYSIDRPILFVGNNKGKNLKEYLLADKDFRKEIDLTEHKKLIKRTIHKVVPALKVKVRPDRYIIDRNAVTSGQARRIGRLMAETELNKFSHKRWVLFEGKDIANIS